MEELLMKMVGERVDVYCSGAASMRGEVLNVDGSVLYLKDVEEELCYVAIDKIIAVWKTRENEPRAGFISGIQK